MESFRLYAWVNESDEYPLQHEKVNVNNVLTDVMSLFYYDFLAKGEERGLQIPS